MHILLPLLAVSAFLMSEISNYTRASFEVERVVLIVLVGLVAVATHAASHVIAASRYGTETRELVLAPWGEYNAIDAPPTPEAALNTHLSGIMANSLVCAVSACILWAAGDASISEMLVPLDSQVLLQNHDHRIVIRWAFCLNYCLVLINLVPAAPFDGSRILKAALQLVMPQLSQESIRTIVITTSRVVGVLFLAIALGLGPGDRRGFIPAWFPFTMLGIIALFPFESGSTNRARATPPRVRKEPPEEVDDESSAEDNLDFEPQAIDEEFGDGPFAQWLEERRENERVRRKEQDASDDGRVDEILARLHQLGPESLSAEDRGVLQRVSDRLRRRKQNRS
jgi:stage IV sporulation protein FB